MRRALVGLLAALACPAGASAAPVLVLGHDGRATRHQDPFLTGPAVTPTPATGPATGPDRTRRSGAGGGTPGGSEMSMLARRSTKRPAPVTVAGTLTGLFHQGQIEALTLRSDIAAYNGALTSERRLKGTRRTELASVTQTIHNIAAAHELTASRLPALFATLAANRQWWTQGPMLTAHQRVEFAGSQLVWEYYPGQGIQLQVLGSFGKADGLYSGGPSDYGAMEQLLSEIVGLASRRGGGLAWEYYFSFDGGTPPWTSAMSQATGLEALTRAYEATHNAAYLATAAQALPIFTEPPPAGVAQPTPRGTRFLQYTFAPGTHIINAFLQTLIGLGDYARVSGNQTAARLFAAGDAEAQAEVPSYDTGAWSLYQPGIEDDLSYHELVTGFLSQLCASTRAAVYCTAAQHFQADLTTPPALTQLTVRARAHRSFALRFRLSKYSHVGITVTRGSTTIFATSASFPYGSRTVTVPALSHAGSYGVRLYATDLAGNVAAVDGTLSVAPAPALSPRKAQARRRAG